MNDDILISDLTDALDWIEHRSQRAIDGDGYKPWSLEYVMSIMREIHDCATKALAEDE